MKLFNRYPLLLLFIPLVLSCQEPENTRRFTVKNGLDMERKQETVNIPVDRVSDLVGNFEAEDLLIRKEGGNDILLSQVIDYDGDGTPDEILFQADFAAGEEQEFIIEGVENGRELKPVAEIRTFSRFVPERIDDYAWENDLVAFRTYGPEAQRITESGAPGGTLTSGMDAWLKRVDYPVIDKWYANHLKKAGAYHIDTGEGYDPYHVGGSRGIGGVGVWENDSLYVSKNFAAYKTIATGPIRTIFELSYAPWKVNGRTIKETKRISLDLGSNLSRYEIMTESDSALPNMAVGLTLHENEGTVKMSPEQGWFRYWEPMDGSELGVGLVMDPEVIKGHLERKTEQKDQSHILVLTDPEAKKLTYYAGFGWKKSGHFSTAQEWDQYLSRFAKRAGSPVVVEFK